MLQDLRFAVRSLRHAPGFTLAAILTFAIGIGATTAIFTVLHAVLLRPLPYADPDRLVVLLHDGPVPRQPRRLSRLPPGARAYDGFSAAQAWSATLAAADGAERLSGLQVSADLFRTLGVPAAIGRTFVPGEDQPGRDRVVVLSDGLWKRRFGGDRAIVGRAIALDGEPFTVIGVMPPVVPVRAVLGDHRDAVAPACRWRRGPTIAGPVAAAVRAVARTASSVEQAQAEASAIAARLAAAYPDTNAQLGISVVPLREKVVSGVRPTLWLLAAHGGARAAHRVRRTSRACRSCAGRRGRRSWRCVPRSAPAAGRLVWQMLAESLLLSAAGGIVGLLLAHVGCRMDRVGAAGHEPAVRPAGSRSTAPSPRSPPR